MARIRSLRLAVLGLAVAALLSACGGGSDGQSGSGDAGGQASEDGGGLY
jgi:ABC-type glycerol-3-phosphate transport system substrate-binding protein